MKSSHKTTDQCKLARALALIIGLLSSWSVSWCIADWSGDVEGGTVVSDSGNQTRLRLTLSNDVRPFTHQIYAEWLRGAENADGYQLGYNPRFWFQDNYYLFGEGRLRVDELFEIEREVLVLAGVGGQFLSSDTQSLYAELGLGSQMIEFESDEETTRGLGIARLGFFKSLVDAFKVDLELSGTVSDDISELKSEVGLSLRVPSGAIRYAYRTRSFKVGDNETVTDDDSFISFTYGF
jgi:putative salt-induced outer membrane protein YdiY